MIINLKNVFSGLVFMLISNSVIASSKPLTVITYENHWENSKWLYSGTASKCLLINKIGSYGKLELVTKSGEDTLLTAILSDDQIIKKAVATVSLPPWIPEYPQQYNSVPMSLNGNKSYISGHNAQQFLNALSQGLSWKIKIENNDKYYVLATSIDAADAINDYRQCLARLLPKPFSYVQNCNIFFKPSSSALESNKAQTDLVAIAAYVAVDKHIKKILINGYSSHVGEYFYNLKLSEMRAKAVSAQLVKLGVNSKIIHIKYHGDRGLDKNDNPFNRRVNVRLVTDGDNN